MTGQIKMNKKQSGRESGGGMERVRTRTWVACSTTAPHAVVLPTRHQLAQNFKVLALRWPRELNALQLQKTHANRKSTSKSRKHFHHFDSRWCKCSQHNQIHFICSAFLFLVVLWAFVACALSNWRKCFLNLQVFFFFCSAFLFLVVLWAFAACALLNWRKCFSNLQMYFFICGAILFLVVLWAFAACALLNWRSVFLICMCFLKLQRVELSRPPYCTLSEILVQNFSMLKNKYNPMLYLVYTLPLKLSLVIKKLIRSA